MILCWVSLMLAALAVRDHLWQLHARSLAYFSAMGCGFPSRAHPGYCWFSMRVCSCQHFCKWVAAFFLVVLAQQCRPSPRFHYAACKVSQQRPSKIVGSPQPGPSFLEIRPLTRISPFAFLKHFVRIFIAPQNRRFHASMLAAKHTSR